MALTRLSANSIGSAAIAAEELAATGVVAGTYGNSTNIPTITVDEDGRLTSATDTSIANLSITTLTTSGNVTIGGNLTVSGTTTTINTETINLADNLITLNSNATGSATENAGIEIERGDDTNVYLRWNETSNFWELTTDGSNYYEILTANSTLDSSKLTSVTSLGTITTGTWQATNIDITYGGTGASTAGAAINNLLPNQATATGKFLTSDGTNVSWATVDALPSQTGQTGKYLTTNGTTASWATVDALPSQTGQTGKYLTTNGTTASWATLSTTLDGLSDVNTSGVADNYVLSYDSASSTWIAEQGIADGTIIDGGNLDGPSSGSGVTVISDVHSIDELSDVVITSASNGQVLTYNGTNWVNSASGSALSAGTGVTISSGSISIGQAVGTSDSPTFAGLTVSGHILPNANVTYDLGSSTYRFRDLYLSGSTIDLGGATMTTDANTGTIALIPKPSQSVPNPTAFVITSDGASTSIATTGGNINYADLGTQLSSDPGFDGSYTSLTNTPDLTLYQLASSAFSGSYNDLTNKPNLFSGSYTDLSNKPTIPSKVSDLTNDSNFITTSGARTALSAGTGVGYDSSTGAISIGQAVETNSNVTFNNVSVTGNLTISGTTTVINSTTVSYVDNIIQLHNTTDSSPLTSDDGKDVGIRIHYYKSSDKHAFLGWANNSSAMEYYVDATETNGVITGTYGNFKGAGLVLAGSTSGNITVQAAAVAGTNTITMPATTGTVVTTGDTGTVTNTMLAGSIANNKLTNSTISGVSLGSDLNALTIGTGLSGTSYNGSAGVTIAIDSTVATLTGTQTLTNKRISPRIASNGATVSGTITPNSDTTDQLNISGLTGAIIMAAPTGTPADGQKLMIRIEDDGNGARGITWTTGSANNYRVIGTTLPTTTTAGKTIYVGCIYNALDSFWDVIAVATQA